MTTDQTRAGSSSAMHSIRPQVLRKLAAHQTPVRTVAARGP